MNKFLNNTKTAVLLSGLMSLIVGAGYLIGGRAAVIPTLAIAVVLCFLAYFCSDKIALATMRATEIDRKHDPVLWDTVEALAMRAGIPMPRVFISPAAAPNAFATGRGPSSSAVCITAGLRQVLTNRELAGVVAHELAHVKHRDILITTIAAVIAGAVSAAAYLALFVGRGDRNPLAALLMFFLAPIAAAMIQMAISRSREYEADRGGAELCGEARGLADALGKLDACSRRVALRVPDAQSSMFIVAPLTGRRMAKLFMTHPPIEERIDRLMEMERERS
ncbi:MAG: M48 family metalloprotease, partial [Bradyrhizobium sp.]|nr:M48 family metalloprotease [Bradyrhizobium sp.]